MKSFAKIGEFPAISCERHDWIDGELPFRMQHAATAPRDPAYRKLPGGQFVRSQTHVKPRSASTNRDFGGMLGQQHDALWRRARLSIRNQSLLQFGAVLVLDASQKVKHHRRRGTAPFDVVEFAKTTHREPSLLVPFPPTVHGSRSLAYVPRELAREKVNRHLSTPSQLAFFAENRSAVPASSPRQEKTKTKK